MRAGYPYLLSLVLAATPCFAADMPVAPEPSYKAPFPAPPVWTWTGFYVGLNAGGGIGRNETTQTLSPIPRFLTLETFNLSPAGFVGGGQIGYNWQVTSNWLVGLEADFQGTSQSETVCLVVCSANVEGTPGLTTTQKLDWFGTARGRLGYTNGDWLWYVSGGGAWGRIDENANMFGPLVGGTSGTHTNSGWVVGGGVETHLWAGWSAKAEYLYMELGSITDEFVIGGLRMPSTVTTSSEIRDHIIRAGINYKFD